MPFIHPLGSLALLAVPAVLLLHLFRRRFRREVVSALFLWSEAREVSAAGRRRERLLRSPSLWCELLAALLLGLAFAGPRGCSPEALEHLVCVLDDSASMSAVPPAAEAGESLRDRAVARLEERIEALGSSGRVTLVLSGARPRLLAGPGALPLEALAALDEYRPSAGRHDVSPAVALALKVASGGAVLLLTDDFQPERVPEEVEVVSVGEPLANTAIVRARRTATEEGEERIAIGVAHTGEASSGAVLELLADGNVVARRELELGPGGVDEAVFTVPVNELVIEARLVAGGGALAIDDAAWLAPPPPRTIALATTLDLDTLAALGLGSRSGSPIGRWLALTPDSIEAEAAVAHAVLGVSESARASLVIEAGEGARRDWIGPFLIEKRHPLLAGVTLDGVIWSAGDARVLPGTPLVSAGNEPVLTEERRGSARVFHANLDPARSTLARSPDWPILLANLAELARAELFGPERTSLAVGETFVYRSRDEGVWKLSGPSNLERELRSRETLVVEDLDRPGVYELSRAGKVRARFALSFADAAESDLSALAAGERASSVALAGLEAGASPLVRALVVAALLMVLVDWWVLGRGRRVVHAEGTAA